MKLAKLFFIMFIIFFYTNCSNNVVEDTSDEQTTKEIVFTLNINENLDTGTADNWIILHNENGELLGFSNYESGDALIFDAEPSIITNKINITHLTYGPGLGNSIDHKLTTYTKIDKGSIWNFNPYNPEFIEPEKFRGERTGDFDTTVFNFPISTDWHFSDSFGNLGGSSEGSGFTTSISLSTYEKSKEYLLLAIDTDGRLKYNLIVDPENNNNLNLNYEEFRSFDSFVNVTIPPNINYFSTVYGFEDNQQYSSGGGFILNFKLFAFSNPRVSSTDPILLGYLDRFKKYKTELHYITNNYFYFYKKYGSKPESIGVDENSTLTVLNESISNFSFQTNLNFNRRASSWRISEGQFGVDEIRTTWTVESSNSDSILIGDIPDEILNEYPDIKIDNLNYSGTRVYLNFDSYTQFIEKRFLSNKINSPFNSEEYIAF